MNDNIIEQLKELKEQILKEQIEDKQIELKKKDNNIIPFHFAGLSLILTFNFLCNNENKTSITSLFSLGLLFYTISKLNDLSSEQKKLDLLKERAKELEKKNCNLEKKKNCKHFNCKDNGYYYIDQNLEEHFTNDKLIADHRKLVCLQCGENIELFKTLNPNWDFTIDGEEINIERQKTKVKK